MSMGAHALCDRPLRSISEWQAAIDASGFDLTLRSDRDLASSSGHLPAFWRGDEAGFECGTTPLSDLTETYRKIDFGGPWSCVYAFYFHTLPSAAGTWMAVAACISVTGGMAFDPQEGLLLNLDQAMLYAREIVADVQRDARS